MPARFQLLNPDGVGVTSSLKSAVIQQTTPTSAMTPQLVHRTNERRRYQRVQIPLLGRYMRENRREYPCQTVNMSAGGVAVRAPDIGERGERIIMYVDTLGRVEGEIVRTSRDGFALRLHASRYRQEKIANTLTWLLNKDRFVLLETRRHERIAPKNPATTLKLSDGTPLSCRLLDISLSGAAVAVDPVPAIGTQVMLGRTPGRVIRRGERSVSIEFIKIQDRTTLEQQFG